MRVKLAHELEGQEGHNCIEFQVLPETGWLASTGGFVLWRNGCI